MKVTHFEQVLLKTSANYNIAPLENILATGKYLLSYFHPF